MNDDAAAAATAPPLLSAARFRALSERVARLEAHGATIAGCLDELQVLKGSLTHPLLLPLVLSALHASAVDSDALGGTQPFASSLADAVFEELQNLPRWPIALLDTYLRSRFGGNAPAWIRRGGALAACLRQELCDAPAMRHFTLLDADELFGSIRKDVAGIMQQQFTLIETEEAKLSGQRRLVSRSSMLETQTIATARSILVAILDTVHCDAGIAVECVSAIGPFLHAPALQSTALQIIRGATGILMSGAGVSDAERALLIERLLSLRPTSILVATVIAEAVAPLSRARHMFLCTLDRVLLLLEAACASEQRLVRSVPALRESLLCDLDGSCTDETEANDTSASLTRVYSIRFMFAALLLRALLDVDDARAVDLITHLIDERDVPRSRLEMQLRACCDNSGSSAASSPRALLCALVAGRLVGPSLRSFLARFPRTPLIRANDELLEADAASLLPSRPAMSSLAAAAEAVEQPVAFEEATMETSVADDVLDPTAAAAAEAIEDLLPESLHPFPVHDSGQAGDRSAGETVSDAVEASAETEGDAVDMIVDGSSTTAAAAAPSTLSVLLMIPASALPTDAARAEHGLPPLPKLEGSSGPRPLPPDLLLSAFFAALSAPGLDVHDGRQQLQHSEAQVLSHDGQQQYQQIRNSSARVPGIKQALVLEAPFAAVASPFNRAASLLSSPTWSAPPSAAAAAKHHSVISVARSGSCCAALPVDVITLGLFLAATTLPSLLSPIFSPPPTAVAAAAAASVLQPSIAILEATSGSISLETTKRAAHTDDASLTHAADSAKNTAIPPHTLSSSAASRGLERSRLDDLRPGIAWISDAEYTDRVRTLESVRLLCRFLQAVVDLRDVDLRVSADYYSVAAIGAAASESSCISSFSAPSSPPAAVAVIQRGELVPTSRTPGGGAVSATSPAHDSSTPLSFRYTSSGSEQTSSYTTVQAAGNNNVVQHHNDAVDTLPAAPVVPSSVEATPVAAAADASSAPPATAAVAPPLDTSAPLVVVSPGTAAPAPTQVVVAVKNGPLKPPKAQLPGALTAILARSRAGKGAAVVSTPPAPAPAPGTSATGANATPAAAATTALSAADRLHPPTSSSTAAADLRCAPPLTNEAIDTDSDLFLQPNARERRCGDDVGLLAARPKHAPQGAASAAAAVSQAVKVAAGDLHSDALLFAPADASTVKEERAQYHRLLNDVVAAALTSALAPFVTRDRALLWAVCKTRSLPPSTLEEYFYPKSSTSAQPPSSAVEFGNVHATNTDEDYDMTGASAIHVEVAADVPTQSATESTVQSAVPAAQPVQTAHDAISLYDAAADSGTAASSLTLSAAAARCFTAITAQPDDARAVASSFREGTANASPVESLVAPSNAAKSATGSQYETVHGADEEEVDADSDPDSDFVFGDEYDGLDSRFIDPAEERLHADLQGSTTTLGNTVTGGTSSAGVDGASSLPLGDGECDLGMLSRSPTQLTKHVDSDSAAHDGGASSFPPQIRLSFASLACTAESGGSSTAAAGDQSAGLRRSSRVRRAVATDVNFVGERAFADALRRLRPVLVRPPTTIRHSGDTPLLGSRRKKRDREDVEEGSSCSTSDALALSCASDGTAPSSVPVKAADIESVAERRAARELRLVRAAERRNLLALSRWSRIARTPFIRFVRCRRLSDGHRFIRLPRPSADAASVEAADHSSSLNWALPFAHPLRPVPAGGVGCGPLVLARLLALQVVRIVRVLPTPAAASADAHVSINEGSLLRVFDGLVPVAAAESGGEAGAVDVLSGSVWTQDDGCGIDAVISAIQQIAAAELAEAARTAGS